MEVENKFKEYMDKYRKKNGDKLTQVTKDYYLWLCKGYFSLKLPLNKLIEAMNRVIKSSQNQVSLASSRFYLGFLGHDEDEILKRLKAPRFSASAKSSTRFLQSKIMSEKEVIRIIRTCKNDFEKLIVKLFYDSGCRRAELLGIKIRDIDFKRNEITVLGKGEKIRMIFFTDSTKDLILKRIVDFALEKDDKLIEFIKSDGKPYVKQDDEVWKFVKKAIMKATGRNLHPHAFRHSSITHYCDRGADLLDAKEIAGHRNVQTTLIYVNVSERRRRQVFKKYGKDIGV